MCVAKKKLQQQAASSAVTKGGEQQQVDLMKWKLKRVLRLDAIIYFGLCCLLGHPTEKNGIFVIEALCFLRAAHTARANIQTVSGTSITEFSYFPPPTRDGCHS